MSKRWSTALLGTLDDNGHEIQWYLTITGINGTNVAYDEQNKVFLVNVRRELKKTGFATIPEAKHWADPDFTKNPKAPTSRTAHLMIVFENGIYHLRKNNGDPIHDYADANIMFQRIKANYPNRKVVVKVTIWP